MFRDFKLRSFISISTCLFFLLMVVSGVVVYVKPEGSVASWLSWKVFGLDKGAWEELHTLAAVLFLLLSAIHIILNWKILFQYISQRKYLSKELLSGVLLLLFVLGSSIWRLPPLSFFMDAGETLSDSWAEQGRPPFERAERLTLLEFCDSPDIGVDIGLAESRLRKAGIKQVDPRFSLENMAEINNTTPAALYRVILGN